MCRRPKCQIKSLLSILENLVRSLDKGKDPGLVQYTGNTFHAINPRGITPAFVVHTLEPPALTAEAHASTTSHFCGWSMGFAGSTLVSDSEGRPRAGMGLRPSLFADLLGDQSLYSTVAALEAQQTRGGLRGTVHSKLLALAENGRSTLSSAIENMSTPDPCLPSYALAVTVAS